MKNGQNIYPTSKNYAANIIYVHSCAISSILKFKKFKGHLFHNFTYGKESTEVQVIQNKGKESENSYQKFTRSPEERHM